MAKTNDIVNLVILWCKTNHVRITNARLQKFLFLLQLEYASEYKQSLFDQAFCCWQFGPVIPSVYYDYCIYGMDEIDIAINPNTVNKEYAIFVAKTLEKYGDLPTGELIRLCRNSEPVKYMLQMFGYDTYIPENCYYKR